MLIYIIHFRRVPEHTQVRGTPKVAFFGRKAWSEPEDREAFARSPVFFEVFRRCCNFDQVAPWLSY